MSNYKDTVKKAVKNGFNLDTCGLDEHLYDFGTYIDLCGMSVEDAKNASIFKCCGGDKPISGDTGDTSAVTYTLMYGVCDDKTIESITFPQSDTKSLKLKKGESEDIESITIPMSMSDEEFERLVEEEGYEEEEVFAENNNCFYFIIPKKIDSNVDIIDILGLSNKHQYIILKQIIINGVEYNLRVRFDNESFSYAAIGEDKHTPVLSMIIY